MNSNALGLIIAYWLHMVATVTWLGGLVALTLFVIPAARKTLGSQDYAEFLGLVQKRLQQIGWFSLVVLIFTGMFQMSGNPNYQGLLAITNQWAVALLLKHLVIGVMILLSAYSTWVVTPAMQRLAKRKAFGMDFDKGEFDRLKQRETWLLQLNLVISFVVLALTALARAS